MTILLKELRRIKIEIDSQNIIENTIYHYSIFYYLSKKSHSRILKGRYKFLNYDK